MLNQATIAVDQELLRFSNARPIVTGHPSVLYEAAAGHAKKPYGVFPGHGQRPDLIDPVGNHEGGEPPVSDAEEHGTGDNDPLPIGEQGSIERTSAYAREGLPISGPCQ